MCEHRTPGGKSWERGRRKCQKWGDVVKRVRKYGATASCKRTETIDRRAISEANRARGSERSS